MKILFCLIGFYCATAFATVNGQTGDWDKLSAGLAVAIVEGIGVLMYRASFAFIGHAHQNSPYSRSRLPTDTLQNIVTNIASQIDGEDRGGKAKKMLAEMVRVSMEQSLRHLQRRASFT